jgi:uncharacterized metal-binding protein YceD (DUF177 family)
MTPLTTIFIISDLNTFQLRVKLHLISESSRICDKLTVTIDVELTMSFIQVLYELLALFARVAEVHVFQDVRA